MIPTFLALAPFAFVAASLVLSIVLFCSLKAEFGRMKKQAEQDRWHWQRTTRDLRLQFHQLRQQVEDLEQKQPTETHIPPSPVRPSLNLSRRSQILRLAKRGERPEQIAAALGLPSNEVELLLKLHHASMQTSARAIPASA